MTTAGGEPQPLVGSSTCPLCRQLVGNGVYRLRTREYLRFRRQRLTTETRTGLCADCDSTLHRKQWQATGLTTLPTLLFIAFGVGKISLVLLGVNLVYVMRHGRYTWADHVLYGREWLPSFAALFEAHGTHPDAVDEPSRSMPTGWGHWWLRVLLAFAVPATTLVLWAKS